MRTETSKKILEYIKQQKRVSPKQLGEVLDISNRAIFKQLKNLLDKNEIERIGSPPKVFYKLVDVSDQEIIFNLSNDDMKFLDQFFYWITPLGQVKEGVIGFSWWCTSRGLPIEKTFIEYKKTIDKYNGYHLENGLISGLGKIRDTFQDVYLDDLFYVDFYAIERFGKTKVGQILNLAKQNQSLPQINDLIEIIKSNIAILVKELKIDCVGFIPPTVKREVQIMNEFKKKLHFNLPVLNITKIKTPIMVPQKTLSKLNDRIENARNTIVVDDIRVYKNILLIDDAVGSGSTINETASHIKDKNLCSGKLYGLAITGSVKGFEVLSEV